MSKIKEIERSIEVIAGQISAQQMLIEALIVEAMRTKALSKTQINVLLEQGIHTFEINKNMTKNEISGAVGTLTSVLDMIKRAKGARLID